MTSTIKDGEIMEQAERVERVLPAILRRLFTLDPEHPVSDLPIGQLRVCTILQDGPQSLSTLGERLGITSSAMTQIADRLERAGLVERVTEAEDRRVRRLSLSAHGEEVMRARRRARQRRAAAALRLMEPDARERLLEALDALSCAAFASAPEAIEDDPTGARQEQ